MWQLKQKTLYFDSQWGSGWHIYDDRWRQRYLPYTHQLRRPVSIRKMAYFTDIVQPELTSRTIPTIRESASRPWRFDNRMFYWHYAASSREWNDPWSSWITFCGQNNSAHRNERAIVHSNHIGQPSKYAHAISSSPRAEYDARLSDTTSAMWR